MARHKPVMASPLHSVKKSVDLAAPGPRGPRVSRIRRDPPPPPEQILSVAEIRERQARDIVIGVLAFTLSLLAILIGFTNASWSPSQHRIVIEEEV